MKTLMLAYANMRKTKSNTVILFIMFILASLLLSAGLLVLVNYTSSFDTMSKDLNTSDSYLAMSTVNFTDEVNDFLNTNKNITDKEIRDGYWLNASVKYKDDVNQTLIIFNNADSEFRLSKWQTVGKTIDKDTVENPIYIPLLFHLTDGYNLGDPFEINYDDTLFTFTIVGFTQDVFFSSKNTGFLGMYLPNDTYEKTVAQIDDKNNATLIFYNTNKIDTEIAPKISEITGLSTTISSTTNYEKTLLCLDAVLVNQVRLMMAQIMSSMIVVFSLIVMAVCIIVVRFRIKNSIEEDMSKIGSLKALGYTTKQIVSSIVMQFGIIALIGSILGVSLSYLVIPILSSIFAGQSGILWQQSFDVMISSISVLIILSVVVITSFVSARLIKKISPIAALRGGISTHSFKRNHIPLEKSKGSVSIVLALKTTLQNAKQSIMIGTILIAVSFSTIVAVVMFYNSVIDVSRFATVPGVEITNAIVIFDKKKDNSTIINEINTMSEIKKTQYIDQLAVKVDHTYLSTLIMDDYSLKETNLIIEGRYPIHGNEIAINKLYGESIEMGLGDLITLESDNGTIDYLITGLIRSVNMDIKVACLTLEGMKKIDPNFKQSELNIYLKNNVDSSEFLKKIESKYQNDIISIGNFEEMFNEGMSTYQNIISQIGIGMIVIIFIVVILVIYFILNSSIIRQKREIGIKKAIGFTTIQLMHQITATFLIPIITGVMIGATLGALYTNSLIDLSMSSIGIIADFIIPIDYIIIFAISIIVISYVTAMLITFSIRKITPYKLVSE